MEIMNALNKIKKSLGCIDFIASEIWMNANRYFALIILSIVVGVSVPLILIQIPGSIIDCLMTGNIRAALGLAFALCATIFVNGMLTDGIKRYKLLFEEKLKGHFIEKVGAHLMKIDYQRLETPETLNEYQFAITCIDEKRITKIVDEFEKTCISFSTMLGVMFFLRELNGIVIALLMLMIVANVLGEIFRMRHVYERHKMEIPAKRQLLYARNELIKKEYAMEIRLFGLSDYITRKVELYAQEICDLWKNTAIKSIKTVGWTYILQGIQLSIVYIYLVQNVINGVISIADFVVYSAAATTFGISISHLVNSLVSVVDTSKYVQNLCDFLNVPLSYDRQNNVPEEPLTIRFEDVSFRYPNRKEDAVSHVNLTIKPGVKYAVVGENGAGKTTFIKLLTGFYRPSSGKITVNGIDLNTIDIDRYSEHFATVFQDFHILGFGLDENISMCSNIDAERIQRAIDAMGLEDIVAHLPEKEKTCMSTAYSPAGVELSGGQKQKLAIARALYRNASYIVLDEPTAALSPQNEFELYQTFHKISRNKGVIFISHRFASCRLCDEIFVFAKGTLAEHGSHNKLMAMNSHYKRLFEQQAKLYAEHGKVSVST